MKVKQMLAAFLSAAMVVSPILPAAPMQNVQAAETMKVLDMNFNESNLADLTGNVTATAELGSPEYVEGHDGTGKAIELNGSILNLGTSEALQPENITVSFWAKAPEGGYGNAAKTFFWFKEKNAYNSNGWYLTSDSDTPLFFSAGTKPYGVGVKKATMSRDVFFPANEWVHVAVTYNSTSNELKCYRNGAEIQTEIIDGGPCAILSSGCTKYVGREGYSNKNGLDGTLDDVQIYNGVLTKTEIAILAGKEEENPVESQPVFAMDFENLTEAVGAALPATFTANTGETVTAHDNVALAEGRNGGKAVDLGFGKGYLTTENTDKLNPASITVSVWLKRYEAANKEARIFWAKPEKSWDGLGWFIGWTSGESMALVTDGKNMAVQKASADTLLPLNEWTNITGVFNSETGDIILYQDGISFASAQAAGAKITKSALTDILIGKSGYGDVGIGCYADDFKIYQKALNPSEVAALAGLTDEQIVKADAEKLSVPVRVSSDFELQTTGVNGSSITWKSDNEAIKIDQDGKAVVTRGSENVTVTVTAFLQLGGSKAEKSFEVIVSKENQPIAGMQKLNYDEIISVGGSVGKRLEDAVNNYAMDYLYGQKMSAYLNEYKNHSHSGWSWLEGEQPGKWLESMANYKWMNDKQIDAAIRDVVDQLAASQTVENKSKSGYNQFGGYLGNGTESIRNNVPVKGMDPYEMYSTLNGLINVYNNYKDDDADLAADAIDCAVKLADYLVATIGDENTKVPYQDGTESTINKKEFWPLAIQNGTTIAGHDVHQGWEGALIIDPMMQLSKTVKEVKGQEAKSAVYSQWVDWVIGNIDKWASSWKGYGDTPYEDLDKVASGEMGIHEVQHYVHAHTFQMTFLGFLKKYQETGDESYLNKVVGAWEDIISRQTYITGTTSVGEHYEAGHNLPNTGSVGETCATNSWTLMNNNLFELTGDAKYQQVVEDVIFNHMFATSTIDGDGYSYHRPLNGSTERFYTGPDCCSSSGMRMQSYVPYYIYTKTESDVYVNQFIESEAKIALSGGKIMHIKQTTDYPETDDIKLEIMNDTTADTLHIRVPDWAETAVIKVNGKEAAKDVTAGEYTKVTVEAGDTVEITYPSELTWVEGDFSNVGSWTMKKGPMVYCADAAYMTVEESQKAFGADVAPVTGTAVINAEDGKAVETTREIVFDNEKYFGKGYMVKMTTPNGEHEIAVVPYANIGQWYRYGDNAPGLYGTGYNNATRYSYAIWLSEGVSDYPEQPEPETKPVVHYDFDTVDGTTVKDISGNGKDATVVGNASYESGKLGNGVSLNGTDTYLQLPEDVIYGLYNMTISVWVNPEEVVNWARVFDFGNGQADPPYPNLFLTVHNTAGNTRLAYEDGSNSHVDTAALQVNTWTHMTITIEGSKAVLYVNGKKAAENVGFHMLPSQIANMTSNFIGKSNYTADSLFKGDIDDFRIYNRALSTDEITMLADGKEPVRTIQTVEQPAAVETVVGTAPVLPAKAKVTYTNGTEGREDIVWEAVEAGSYAQTGTFQVKGKVGENEVVVTVVVKENSTPIIPEVLADFNFDAEGEFFDGGNAKAAGTYTLEDHGTGKALKLNGNNQFLTVTDKNGDSLLTGVKEMTVSYQIKPENSKTNWGFFAAPNADKQEYEKEHYLGIVDISGTTRAERYNGGVRPAVASTQTGYNGWYYVTVVYTEGATTLYINGEKAAEEASTYALADILGENSILYIGKSTWVEGEYATSLIDNYKIVSKALTAEEVKAEAVKYVEKDALKAAIDTKVDAEDTYTAESWKVYADALTAANTVYNKKDASQAEVDAAAKTLTDAVKALKKKPVVVEVDKTELQDAIKNAISSDQKEKYTEESWKAYEDALAKAKEAEADQGATQAEVDAATKALADAQKALKEKPKRPFVDVDMETGNWYYDAVYYNFDRGIMNGVNPTHFEPLSNLARAQFAIILHNMEGKTAVSYEPKFKDVAEGEWYTNAILWASSKKIVTGYTDGSGKFGWGDNILREQMAVMMYRYAKNFKEYDVSESADFDNFADAAFVDDYAKEAMKWAVGAGIITGKDLDKDGTPESLDPLGYASRAECAIIIQRFLEKYEK